MEDLTSTQQQADITNLSEEEMARQIAEQLANTPIIKINPEVEGFSYGVHEVDLYNTAVHLNVIKRIFWSLKYVEGEHKAVHYGVVSFPTVDDNTPIEDFKLVEDITTDKVIEWVNQQNPKMNLVEAQLKTEIFEKKRLMKSYPAFCQLNVPKV